MNVNICVVDDICRVFRYRSRRKEVYLKDPDGALITAKTLSVQRCTLYVPDGPHLVYVVEAKQRHSA